MKCQRLFSGKNKLKKKKKIKSKCRVLKVLPNMLGVNLLVHVITKTCLSNILKISKKISE